MWGKKIHVQSSMLPKEGRYSLLIGRWQPLHLGHKAMFQEVLNNGGKVCIAIRDIEPDEKNPFTTEYVFNLIADEYYEQMRNGMVKVIIIPDICSVEFGRGVGYDIIEHIPPPEISEISATKIREEMKSKGEL